MPDARTGDGRRTCPACGLTYWIGDESAFHRRRHAEWTRAARPGPHPRFAALAAVDGRAEVHWTSPLWLRQAVYRHAVMFRREFRYDFVQWAVREDDGPYRTLAFVLAGGAGGDLMAGSCCFRWREWTDRPPGWAMSWVWLAPAFRRRGILSRHWPSFVGRFGGDFLLEPPLSDAMAAFAARAGHPAGA